jgi:hypothetical protein
MHRFQNGSGGVTLIDGGERAGSRWASSSPWCERWTVVRRTAQQRLEAAAVLSLVWSKEELRVGGLGQLEAKAQGGAGQLGKKQGVQDEFGKRWKINSKLILNYPRP